MNFSDDFLFDSDYYLAEFSPDLSNSSWDLQQTFVRPRDTILQAPSTVAPPVFQEQQQQLEQSPPPPPQQLQQQRQPSPLLPRLSSPKRAWTKEEDEQLKAAYSEHGTNWTAIAEKMTDRNNKACRERFINYIDSKLVDKQFYEDPDFRARLMETSSLPEFQDGTKIKWEALTQVLAPWGKRVSPNRLKNAYHSEEKKARSRSSS